MMTNRLDTILDEAFAAYNANQWDEAESLCREVLSADAACGDALYLLGLIAYQAGALAPAADLLFCAVKNYPDNALYDLTLASVLQRQGHLSEALSRYEKYPDHPAALAQRGFIYLQQGNTSFADSAFCKALKLSPDLPEARLGLALLNHNEKALLNVAETANLPDAWYYLAKSARTHQHNKKALTFIEKTGLGAVAYLIEKGLILEALNRPQDALETYRIVAQKDPYCADAWGNQANIFRHQGDFSAAEDYYKRALAQDATHIAIRHNLADLMDAMGRQAEALEQYRTILSQQPDYTPSLYNLAIILERTGAYADAAGLYVKLLLQPDSPKMTPWRLADTLTALFETEPKLAVRFAEGWQKNFPDDPIANHTYAALTHQKEADLSAYTKRLYDDFSDTYDKKMKQLKSRAVPQLAALLPPRNYTMALDIGCGTGAWGRAVGSRIKTLTGIDLSENMLTYARKTNCYQHLITADAIDYLSHHTRQFDLISAIEVLGYFPDITNLFYQVGQHLKPDGLFAFSVETTSEELPLLAPHGRYLYPKTYIDKQLETLGLVILKQKEIPLRLEGKGSATGYLIVARKAA